jgi:membrane protein DedA with SNARE-associated domain
LITEAISKLAVQILDLTGYYGAAFLMALESMIAPIPSEAVMPFVGFQVADGKWSLPTAIVATTIGSLIGSLVSFLMGFYGGRPLILKVGRYLLLDQHDLALTEDFFNRRRGTVTVFASRFIPVVRHLISVPAGTGRMPILPFITATVIGATMWNSFLLACGMLLREHWHIVMRYSHQVDIVVIILLVSVFSWFVKFKLGKRVSH